MVALASCLPGQSQFPSGAMYLMSAVLDLPPNQIYPGIRRVDPFTGATFPLIQFTSNAVYPASAAYDPYRDRIIAYCTLGTTNPNPQLQAIDAAGGHTTLSASYLVRLAPRGDGKIYGYKAGAAGNDLQKIFYLDAANQEHVLLDVGGASPWLLFGGAPAFGDPIRATIYDPVENALFLALNGDNTTPACGAPSFNVSIRKLPLTTSGTALRAPAVCAEFDVAGTYGFDELPLGFSYGPEGSLVLCVHASTSGAMPRFLRIDPTTTQITPFAIVGPYYGDVAIACGAYSPLTGRALMLDGGNDVFRAYAPGQSGGGQQLASYGPPGLGNAVDTLFVVGAIGPTPSLRADVPSVSSSAGGVQNLVFAPGTAFAGDLYLIAGSVTGWAPGFQLGSFHVPMNYDAYTDLSLQLANTAFFVDTAGVLGPTGVVQAQIVLPPGVLTALAGLSLHHVAFAADSPAVFTHVSNAAPLLLLP
jgi:hypothetical protein